MIIYENSKSIIELDNGKVVKHLKNSVICKKWFKTYQRFSKNDPRFVKVFEFVDQQTYTMEYISETFINLESLIKKSENYDKLTKDDIINITALLPSIFVKTLDFSRSLPNNEFFIHSDMLLPNFVFTRSKKLVVIDPDSFALVTNLDHIEKYYMSSINIMYNIQKIYAYKDSQHHV